MTTSSQKWEIDFMDERARTLPDILEAKAAANIFFPFQCVSLCLGPLVYKADAKTGVVSQLVVFAWDECALGLVLSTE